MKKLRKMSRRKMLREMVCWFGNFAVICENSDLCQAPCTWPACKIPTKTRWLNRRQSHVAGVITDQYNKQLKRYGGAL